MPLLVTAGVEVTPEEPAPNPLINRPDHSSRLEWTSAQGVTTVLTAPEAGYVAMPGVRGLDLPPYQLYRRESGALDGDVVTGVRAEPREVFVPIRVWGASREEARGRRRQLARDVDPQPTNLGGAGRLTVTEFDGTSRWIEAHYTEGMEGSEGQDEAGLCWANYGITWMAANPYWSRPTRTLFWRAQESADRFLPILPLEVVSGAVIGEGMEIAIVGTARAWPVWTLTGPLSSGTVLRSVTLGKELTLDRELTGGDTIVIDTRPRRKSVTLNGSTNAYGDLALGSALWPLAPTVNEIDVIATGVGEGTEVALSYTPQELTA
ncbi:phage distal tail protein [Streptomonospora litoralis]|uniref:Phage tail protein n=1 Tax=Streptomonospora litoralis TaxID=2498135 RepID=A0A4P6Q042_9ACTN|nr:phage tail domain-containing protein [Streptomonospora litoralis]QBI53420.1 Phage tail protein [Streptomonospora litoralis]